jgi:hypothetical protein
MPMLIGAWRGNHDQGLEVLAVNLTDQERGKASAGSSKNWDCRFTSRWTSAAESASGTAS